MPRALPTVDIGLLRIQVAPTTAGVGDPPECDRFVPRR
jgi:hypothetical protein